MAPSHISLRCSHSGTFPLCQSIDDFSINHPGCCHSTVSQHHQWHRMNHLKLSKTKNESLCKLHDSSSSTRATTIEIRLPRSWDDALFAYRSLEKRKVLILSARRNQIKENQGWFGSWCQCSSQSCWDAIKWCSRQRPRWSWLKGLYVGGQI